MLASDATTVVLVEGLSDAAAVEAAAARLDRDLHGVGVGVVPMGGATNIGHFLETYGPEVRDLRLAGLCDAGEVASFVRALDRTGLAARGFFVCERDLEDELIRAVGVAGVERIIEAEGELASLRQLQQMPFHRDRPVTEQLHRFFGSRSGRKHRYAPRLVEALDVEDLPAPLRALVDHVT